MATTTEISTTKSTQESSFQQKNISVLVAWWMDIFPEDESAVEESCSVISVPVDATDDDITKTVAAYAEQHAVENNYSTENQYWEWEGLPDDDN